MTKQAPITISEQQGEHIAVVGDNYRLVITGEQTDKRFSVIDMMIPPGGGPGPHSHTDFDESFYVVDGEVEVKSEAGTYEAKKGAFVTIPRGGIIHEFKNKTDKPAHLLCILVGAGLENFFKEIGQPTAANKFPPPTEMTPEKQKEMKKIAKKYGQEVYPPDFLDKK